MTNEARPILETIIADFAPEKIYFVFPPEKSAICTGERRPATIQR